MEKMQVKVAQDWAGATATTPLLVFSMPCPDFGEKRDSQAKPQQIQIVKRTRIVPADGLAAALTYLPATLHVPGFTMEMCQADVFSWHELANSIHKAQFLMACIDEVFIPDTLVETGDLSKEAVADALSTTEFELQIEEGAAKFWNQSTPCSGCADAKVCLGK